MKKRIGILLAVFLCMSITFFAWAEGETPPSAAPTETATVNPGADEIVIAPAAKGQDDYKDLLMDTFKLTTLGQNATLRAQIGKILYRDEITVTAENYTHIVLAVNKAMKEGKLSDNASLESYTEDDLNLAAGLIDSICEELGVDYSIDPSNDSQNEYARVITISKNGKVLGKINSDAKTDLGDLPSVGWIIGGGVLLAASAAFGIALVLVASRRKETA